jgi:hypothetical protein
LAVGLPASAKEEKASRPSRIARAALLSVVSRGECNDGTRTVNWDAFVTFSRLVGCTISPRLYCVIHTTINVISSQKKWCRLVKRCQSGLRKFSDCYTTRDGICLCSNRATFEIIDMESFLGCLISLLNLW